MSSANVKTRRPRPASNHSEHRNRPESARPSARPKRLSLEPANTTIVAKALAENQPFIAAEGDLSWSYLFIKRLLDILGASLVIVAASPVLLTVLVVLTITTRGRPLFSQTRVGYRGRHFKMWKFRTMRLDADRVKHTVGNEASGPVFKNRRDPRITRIGRFLRKSSLDETPQLFSVLFGQMSLVGPRPLYINEFAKVAAWQRRRQAVKPGLTCLWQVSGRSEIGFTDWARMDLWYVKNQNLWTDLWLLWKTPWVIVTGKGAY